MILSSNDQFRSMTPAQKSFVLSMLVNKVFQNPRDYGLSDDGILRVGDKLDFTKLFEDIKEIKSIFDKAKETITPGSPQEKSILANNGKIASWVKNNPNAKLTNDKVADILSEKPVEKAIFEPVQEPPKLEPAKTEAPEMIKSVMPEVLSKETGKIMESQIHQEIAEAKQRLTELEGGKSMRTMMGDVSMVNEVETAFRSEIDSIYGKSGLLGMGRVVGVDTKEWGEMARLPANKVVEYYTGDSTKSGLPANIVEKLSKSKSHDALMKQTAGLMEQSQGAVKPFENENVESFLKRLGGYVLKTHSQDLTKAA